ncbi:MAG TPA: uroporphyrinogen-III synthase, partial [Xanthomonadaceae bacterium]|nr:uroporphyrinogen-III synthase [Xanthomonadaceae bacterium]
GLVTAPGGRDRIAPALAGRGARVCRADVYRRLPPRLDAASVHALESAPPPRAFMLSSLEALTHLLAQLPAGARARLLDAVAVCASPRLAEAARGHGFAAAVPARDASPTALTTALCSHANHEAFR